MSQPELPGMPPADDQPAPAAGRGARVRRAPSAAASADAFEAALLEALDRPAVRARLAELVQQALGDAVDGAAQRAGSTAEPGMAGTGTQARVLVVGLPPEHGRTLAAQVPGGVELRMARPGDGHERLRALARGCTAVVVDEAVTAELEEFLSTLRLPTLHHEGSTRRLAQRLAELGDRPAPDAG